MSLQQNMLNVLTRIGSEFKTVNTLITGTSTGSLAGLSTTAKTHLVAAINELKAEIDTLDGTVASGITMADVNTRLAEIIGAAPESLDTLNEIATALNNDPNFSATIMTELGNRVRFDATQTLTATQQEQARANIDAAASVHSHNDLYFTKIEIGDITTNLVTHFESGLV